MAWRIFLRSRSYWFLLLNIKAIRISIWASKINFSNQGFCWIGSFLKLLWRRELSLARYMQISWWSYWLSSRFAKVSILFNLFNCGGKIILIFFSLKFWLRVCSFQRTRQTLIAAHLIFTHDVILRCLRRWIKSSNNFGDRNLRNWATRSACSYSLFFLNCILNCLFFPCIY
jgi:hypothetical protein